MASTAPNTATCSKYLSVGTADGFSEIKPIHGSAIESPFTIRRFIDCENGVEDASKNIQEKGSEFKSYYHPHHLQNSNFKNIQDYIPYNFDEMCINMAQAAGSNEQFLMENIKKEGMPLAAPGITSNSNEQNLK